jgi:hypothetical protein
MLNSYAVKNNNPLVDLDPFVAYFEKYLKRAQEGEGDEKIDPAEWLERNLAPQLSSLAEQGKIAINGKEKNRICLCDYYAERVLGAYKNPDNDAALPFPDEFSLGLKIPDDQKRTVKVTAEMAAYLAEPQETDLPVITLKFPGEYGSALVLSSMIPFRLLEICMLKIRNFLQNRSNRVHVQYKLGSHFAGREAYLRDTLDQIQNRPMSCVRDMGEAGEFIFYFWTYFCSLIRSELTIKNELLAEESAVLQSAFIVEICIGFFRSRVSKAREAELALKSFELEMEKPPYYFSREAIAGFKDNRGFPLLGQYSQEELDGYIKKRCGESAVFDEMPELLIFHTGDGASWLIKKSKVIPLCIKLLAEARVPVSRAISRRWKNKLQSYLREPAMDDDGEFEKLLAHYLEEYAPVLSALFRDHRLYLIHEEMVLGQAGTSEFPRFFARDELLPLRVLLLLKRREILADVKLLLPFWNSFVSGLLAFFSRLRGKKQVFERTEEEAAKKVHVPETMRILQNAALEAEAGAVPDGYTLESYLEELTSRWGKLLNKQAKTDLVNDVNALIRDKFRQFLKTAKRPLINKNTFIILTDEIMRGSQGLRQISEQNALSLYIKLYLIKLCRKK